MLIARPFKVSTAVPETVEFAVEVPAATVVALAVAVRPATLPALIAEAIALASIATVPRATAAPPPTATVSA